MGDLDAQRVVIRFTQAPKGAESAKVTGDFNDWGTGVVMRRCDDRTFGEGAAPRLGLCPVDPSSTITALCQQEQPPTSPRQQRITVLALLSHASGATGVNS